MGKKSYDYPMAFIMIGLIVFIGSALGLILPDLVEYEFDPDILWSETTSEPYIHFDNVVDTFGEEPSPLILLLISKEDNAALTPNAMDEAYSIYNTIYDISTTYDGQELGYKDACLLEYPSSNVCDSEKANLFPVLLSVHILMIYIFMECSINHTYICT